MFVGAVGCAPPRVALVSRVPSPLGNFRVPIALATSSQPRELRLQWVAQLEPHGGPAGWCHGDAPQAGGTPGDRERGVTSHPPLPGAGPCGEGSGRPQTSFHPPPSPLPLLERKEELKMKLKHNSIRSGSRIKSSALIVHWQALPARQQTQCYQGTEGRFVCTGRESCCVRPACPEPGEHRDTRMGPRAAEGSSTPTPSLWVPLDGAAASGPSWWISSAAEGQHSGVMLDDENTRVPVSRVFPGAGAPRGVAQPPALHFAVSHRAGRAGCPMLSPYASPWTASRIPHPTLISARALAVPSVPGLPAGLLWGQHSLLSLSLYTPVIFNSAYANPKSGMSSGPGPRGNGHGANFLPFLPLFLYNTQQRFSSAA